MSDVKGRSFESQLQADLRIATVVNIEGNLNQSYLESDGFYPFSLFFRISRPELKSVG